ncbi:hypothetical protein ABZ901_22925 [Actinacidiphila alni]|uniref:hypothetical protein n=1 Tax=Actinacidiphila alni TaxID=380248 RepID=UPI0034098F75
MVEVADGNGRLSDEEFEQLKALLRRFCAHDLDQWEAWKLRMDTGHVAYVRMQWGPMPDADDPIFREI